MQWLDHEDHSEVEFLSLETIWKSLQGLRRGSLVLSLASGLCLCFNAVFSLFIGVVALDTCKHQKLENFDRQTFLKGLFKAGKHPMVGSLMYTTASVMYFTTLLIYVWCD